MIDYNFQTSKEIMAVLAKRKWCLLCREIDRSLPAAAFERWCSGVDEAAAGKQGTAGARVYKNSGTFWDLWDGTCQLPERLHYK
jgi:hypothetical protein